MLRGDADDRLLELVAAHLDAPRLNVVDKRDDLVECLRRQLPLHEREHLRRTRQLG